MEHEKALNASHSTLEQRLRDLARCITHAYAGAGTDGPLSPQHIASELDGIAARLAKAATWILSEENDKVAAQDGLERVKSVLNVARNEIDRLFSTIANA